MDELLNLHFCQHGMVMSRDSPWQSPTYVSAQAELPVPASPVWELPVIASCCGKRCTGRHGWSDGNRSVGAENQWAGIKKKACSASKITHAPR